MEIIISHSESAERFLGWADQRPVFPNQSIDPSGSARLGAGQTLLYYCRNSFSGAAMPERFGSNTTHGLTDWQVTPSSPTQTQSGSATPNSVSLVFWSIDADEASLIDPYSPERTVIAGLQSADERHFVFFSGHGAARESEPMPPTVARAIILPENWEKEDDLRFDLLVEKEAFGKLSLEELEELERLSDKRDRTIARISDEDLLRERMRIRALIELQDLLESMRPSSHDEPKTSRIQRGPAPDRVLNDNNVHTAKPFLLRDSGGRCAYSMIHESEIGKETIEVDHFEPCKVDGEKNHNYDNFLPAYGPCNRSKGSKWPSAEAEASGVRFLNATAEQDYGVHLFEDPKSHRIVAVRAAGKYHLRYLALNSEYLILKRKHRSMASGLRDKVGLIQGLSPYDTARLDDLLGNAESAIPPIDPPPFSPLA